jgi:hypothetical protein
MNLKTIAMATVILTTLGSATLFAQTAPKAIQTDATTTNNNAVTLTAEYNAVDTALTNMTPAIDVQPGTPSPASINMAVLDDAAIDPSTVFVSTPRIRAARRNFAFLELRKAHKVDVSYNY